MCLLGSPEQILLPSSSYLAGARQQRETYLKGHDAAQVHLQTVGWLEDSLLVLDPADSLATLNVERLHSVCRVQFLPLCLRLLVQLRPLVVQLKQSTQY